jgi:peptidoglycan hydrolase CwlO-like protein
MFVFIQNILDNHLPETVATVLVIVGLGFFGFIRVGSIQRNAFSDTVDSLQRQIKTLEEENLRLRNTVDDLRNENAKLVNSINELSDKVTQLLNNK